MKKNITIIMLFIGLLSLSQCSEYFDTDTNDVLASKNYIGSVDELLAGFRGIASAVQSVADQAVFLTELRGDLLEPTSNAPQDLWDVYSYSDKENSYTDPKGYYNVIVNANDFISKAFEYKSKNPKAIQDGDFEPLISGAIRFKCWAYMMLAKIYGTAVYFDDPLTEYSDISKYPALSQDEVFQKCLSLMQDGVNGIPGTVALPLSDILSQDVTSNTDIKWDMICPNSDVLLMELNLWAGNYQKVVDLAVPFIWDNGTKRYKVSNEDWNGEWSQFFYSLYTSKTKELITVAPYSYDFNQTNRIITYFSDVYPNKYYLRPTQTAMDRFKAQIQVDGVSKTDRYRGDGYTFDEINGNWVLRKFLKANESPQTVYKSDVAIVLYRAADVHLFLAEALNQLDMFPEASAILNDGLENYFSLYASNLRAPFNNLTYNATLVQNMGLRKRVSLAPSIQLQTKNDTLFYTIGSETKKIASYSDTLAFKKVFDESLVEETCMESAGEAKSFFAMERVAKRYDDPSIIADRVSAKYSGALQQTIHEKLMKKEWFVPFNLTK